MISDYAEIHQVYARYQDNADEDKREAQKRIERICVNRPPAEAAGCVSDELQTYYTKQSTQADLQAQQDMAIWAKMMFFASLVSIPIAILGLFYVRRTFHEARETTKAALASVAQGREHFVTENRPWLRLDDPRIDKMLAVERIDGVDQNVFKGGKVRFALTNVGNMPAVQCYMQSNWLVTNEDDFLAKVVELTEPLIAGVAAKNGGAKILLPNMDTITPLQTFIPVELFSEWAAHNTRLFVVFMASYRFTQMSKNEPSKIVLFAFEFTNRVSVASMVSADEMIGPEWFDAALIPDITMIT
ncbi:hypothetical protein IHQ71_27885 [Rhizobium sp. TH2]|uniref:hypothetical protein n=1 Tax=Rhizobium sp. TH2 TaxID=2775403 RepID=UPI0021579FAB|nr:hypothetical protein [Rhizobium sp. TH2]UVC08890.1 hypothetical protein IHQ71_27885 [Rhizobium sp. TH2]